MRCYIIFASVGLSLLIYSIDIEAVAVAFPHLTRDLGTNVLWAGWTISIYFIAVTGSMPLMGNLSDTLMTMILRLSSIPANGFRYTFIGFGLGLLLTIPLVFLMPSGKKGWEHGIGSE